jgi:acyl carrier protein
MASYENDVRTFITENFLFGQEDESLKPSDSLLERGIIDSTGVLELVTFLEEKYLIKLDDEELIPENLDSIDRLVHFIGRKVTIAA